MSKSFWLMSAACFALATPAMAQDTPPADPASEETDDLSTGEIIVTATRRASPLSDVPIAVSAVTAESLQNSGASDIRQLNQLAPSLLVSSTGTEANGSARIRGIGTVGDNPGLESSVAVFIDGVYRSRTGAGLNELGEIERVEVLRGPQGTLFGRNASAGLLNIVSKKPEFEFAANGELTYGNYDYLRGAARITGPVSETIAASLDGVYVKRDGFLDLVDTAGNKVGDTNDRDRYFLRGQLLFEPTSDISFRLIGDYTKRDESCCGAAYKSIRAVTDPTPGVPGDSRPVPGTNPQVAFMQLLGAYFPPGGPYSRDVAITPGRDYFSRTRDWGVSGELNWDFGGATLTSITAYRKYKSSDGGDFDYSNLDLLFRPDDGGASRQFKTFTQELRLQGEAFDGRLDWLVGGYYANEKLRLRDNINFGADYGRYNACQLVTAINPLLRSPTSPGCLVPFVAPGVPGSAALAAAFPTVNVPTGRTEGAVLVEALNALTSISATNQQASLYRQDSENYAAFTHNIFEITDTLSLTLGLRYTHERKDFSADFNLNNPSCATLQGAARIIAGTGSSATIRSLLGNAVTLGCLFNTNPALNALDLNDSRSEDELTGTGVISWKPTPDLLTYASYSKGYKSGGFNLDRSALSAPTSPPTNASVSALQFGAEKVDAYELGAKYSTSSFTLNVAAFYQSFRNFQLNTFNGLFFVVQNINGCSDDLGGADQDSSASGGAATGVCDPDSVNAGVISKGVEIEANLRPARDINVGLGYTYARVRLKDDLVGGSNGSPLIPELALLPGNQLSNAPDHVATASFAWTPEIGSNGMSALFYVDGRMTSDYNTGSDLFLEKAQDGYAIANARIGLRGPDEHWSVEVWGQNIFNKGYDQVAFNSPLQGSSSQGQVELYGGTSTRLFSAYLAEPRTYGITLRGKF